MPESQPFTADDLTDPSAPLSHRNARHKHYPQSASNAGNNPSLESNFHSDAKRSQCITDVSVPASTTRPRPQIPLPRLTSAPRSQLSGERSPQFWSGPRMVRAQISNISSRTIPCRIHIPSIAGPRNESIPPVCRCQGFPMLLRIPTHQRKFHQRIQRRNAPR